MSKTVDDCVEELALRLKGTDLDREARFVLAALRMGYCLYHPYPEKNIYLLENWDD